jgi:polysaccharide export outer membrane protein
LPYPSAPPHDSSRGPIAPTGPGLSRGSSTTSLRDFWGVMARRRGFIALVLLGLLLLCGVYCLVAPKQYEAVATVALRQGPASSLNMEAPEPVAIASLLSAPLQLETLANLLRSDGLAWRVITGLKLYQEPGFMGDFAQKFPGFHAEAAGVDAQAYLLERFQKRLHVQSVPRTLLIAIRFRSNDAALSAAVVNALIHDYLQQENDTRIEATVKASDWLESQLKDLKQQMDQQNQRLTAFQTEHGILGTTGTEANGQQPEAQHSSILLEIDELGRQLASATSERVLHEAEYRAANRGDPELVIASDPNLQNQGGGFATALLIQIHSRESELKLEQAQLGAEHGPNFPRVVEIRQQLQDLDRQKQREDARLVEQFRGAWQTASDHEQLVRKNLNKRTADGLKLNDAAADYAVMREEANSSHEIYMRVVGKVAEAGLASGIHSSSISVVDPARQPVKPVTPDPLLDLAITFVAGFWLAVGGALLMESLGSSHIRAAVVVVAAIVALATARGQAPTPSTSGLPTGVVRIPPTEEKHNLPNPKEAPAVWNSETGANQTGTHPAVPEYQLPMAAPIGPGDTLDVSEYHLPEFHSDVRVSQRGTVTLPMVSEIQVGGMDEQGAAQAIDAALLAQGMLLHPQVSVVVTAYVGQDVSVLGEVARPGVYPYTLHHRLLDVISAASGLAPNAGRLVNVFKRDDPKTPHPVVLDPSGTDTLTDHNPELSPGDTVQVSRAGLVYVIGDVARPGGFPVDPVQGLTVVRALTLAWGQTQNASSKALLIREQKGGRTLTTLNLRRMLHGEDPDQPIRDGDILFVPDSMAKNLWNKSLEAAVQSAIGVTIYAVLVYSQRF